MAVNPARKTRVALLFGGRSTEHSVSIVSAASIAQHLDPERFELLTIGITEDGVWVLADPTALGELQADSLPVVTGGPEVVPLHDPARRGAFTVLTRRDEVAPETLALLDAGADVVFPVLHGPYGEDGTIQGLLELLAVPYVGPGVLASAAGMDKEFTKKLLAAEGLPIGHQIVLRHDQPAPTDEQLAGLTLPVFVKPARGGSSIGISRVTAWPELDAAIALAREHDPKVVIENGISGAEVECGVLEFPTGEVRASAISQIRLGEAAPSFYDFEAKYLEDVVEFDLPAKLDPVIADEIRAVAVAAFKALDCQGLARVDFFVTEDGPLINEINTMPGFTSISQYPRMWDASGVDYRTLLATLIETALTRGTGLR